MKITYWIWFLFLLTFSFNAYADIKINSWNETIELTNYGKKSEIVINAQATNLEKGYYHNSFSFIFGAKQDIKIIQAAFNYNQINYLFNGNKLTITFNNKQFNNDKFIISFVYQETYEKIHQYLRKEAIYIPDWVAGADANVTINFLYSLESATLNNKIQKIGNKFIYSGKVPEGGVLEIIKLTPSRDVWDISITNNISNTNGLKQLNVFVPLHFDGGGQLVEGYHTVSDPPAQWQQIRDGDNVLQYNNINVDQIDIISKARIYTGKVYRIDIKRNPGDYLKVNPDDKLLLEPLLERIKIDPALKDLPLYAAIGRFVNKFIKYEPSLVNKRLSLSQILQGKAGVCVEYSKLYNSLARIAGIPSAVVSGIAHGEYDRFEGHSWNLVYYQNRWIYVDPTWDLMSGVVSSSHIYFCDNDCQAMSIKFTGSSNNKVKLGNSFEVKKIW